MVDWLDDGKIKGRGRNARGSIKVNKKGKGGDALEFQNDMKRQQTTIRARKSIFIPKKAPIKDDRRKLDFSGVDIMKGNSDEEDEKDFDAFKESL